MQLPLELRRRSPGFRQSSGWIADFASRTLGCQMFNLAHWPHAQLWNAIIDGRHDIFGSDVVRPIKGMVTKHFAKHGSAGLTGVGGCQIGRAIRQQIEHRQVQLCPNVPAIARAGFWLRTGSRLISAALLTLLPQLGLPVRSVSGRTTVSYDTVM